MSARLLKILSPTSSANRLPEKLTVTNEHAPKRYRKMLMMMMMMMTKMMMVMM